MEPHKQQHLEVAGWQQVPLAVVVALVAIPQVLELQAAVVWVAQAQHQVLARPATLSLSALCGPRGNGRQGHSFVTRHSKVPVEHQCSHATLESCSSM